MCSHLTQFYHTCWLVLKGSKPKLCKDMALIERAESMGDEFDIAKAWFRLKHEHPRLRKLMDDIELDCASVSVVPIKKPKSPTEDKKNDAKFTTV